MGREYWVSDWPKAQSGTQARMVVKPDDLAYRRQDGLNYLTLTKKV